MTFGDGLNLVGGGLIFVSALLSPLLSWAFCARPCPRWMRAWRDVALALAGARIVVATATRQPPEWWGGLIFVFLGVMGALIAGWNIRAALGPNGDRCAPPGDGRA